MSTPFNHPGVEILFVQYNSSLRKAKNDEWTMHTITSLSYLLCTAGYTTRRKLLSVPANLFWQNFPRPIWTPNIINAAQGRSLKLLYASSISFVPQSRDVTIPTSSPVSSALFSGQISGQVVFVALLLILILRQKKPMRALKRPRKKRIHLEGKCDAR